MNVKCDQCGKYREFGDDLDGLYFLRRCPDDEPYRICSPACLKIAAQHDLDEQIADDEYFRSGARYPGQ